MPTLSFGVVDQAYSDAGSSTATTGEVAEHLEKKYAVMATFYELYQDKIAQWMADAVQDELDDVIAGGHRKNYPFAAADAKIEEAFRLFLDGNEMAHLVAGLSEGESAAFNWKNTFDGAGKNGANKRKKAGKNQNNAARPAFVDTGLYRTSFRSWVEF